MINGVTLFFKNKHMMSKIYGDIERVTQVKFELSLDFTKKEAKFASSFYFFKLNSFFYTKNSQKEIFQL